MTPRFVDGNTIRLLENGTQYFPVLIAAIESATIEIHLETYIFANDATARAVAHALEQASKRGVSVRVMVDGFGAKHFIDDLGADLLRAGCEVMVYRAEAAKHRFRRNRLRRLHRKLTVIDGRIAFVGGINIIDDNSDTEPGFPRYDYAVIAEGPVVADIHEAVHHLWRLVRWAYIGRRQPAPAMTKIERPPCGQIRAGFLVRDNIRHRRDIENAYLAAIESAESEVLIACAYFLPGKQFRETLVNAALRGISVTLLLQNRGDHPVMRNAERHLYHALLPAGIRVVEYHRGFLHAKVGIADRHWATVGSSNIDPFSLLLSREANVVIDDKAFAEILRERLHHAIESGGTEVRVEDMNSRSWWSRLVSRAAYTFVRFAVSISQYGGKDYRE